ncbi:MAG: Holliday junction resolvase RuvX [Lachnospiraceae bacterium]|nr:Holliday junction resolvase RuvX [Lachnospiraceae bacterium]
MESLKGPFLGIDFGDRHVGVAKSDALGLLAHGVETICRKRPSKLRSTLSRIEELCALEGIGGIVLGLPLLEDGTEGLRCEKTREFGQRLEVRLHLPVVYWDERLTTIEAYEYMKNAGVSAAQREKMVDEISAVVILQDFLDNQWNR